MEYITTIAINHRVAKRYGTRAAAVFGWIFSQCQAQVSREQCKRMGIPKVYRKTVRVRVSCSELGRLLHMSRHTVEAILHMLADDELIDVWLPRGEDRTRAYSIAPKGFTLLGRWAGEWYTADDGLFLWGLDTRVASRVGVNAAIVFQYLWFWAVGHRWGSHYTKDGRVWLPYTAAELARWIVFMSGDVIGDALHTLEREGLLLKMRERCLTKWSVSDTGYELMGETPPVQVVPAYSCGEAPRAMQGREHPSTSEAGVFPPLHPTFSPARLRGDAVPPKDPSKEGIAPFESPREDAASQASLAAMLAAQRAARNWRRRLRRKGLRE